MTIHTGVLIFFSLAKTKTTIVLSRRNNQQLSAEQQQQLSIRLKVKIKDRFIAGGDR